MLPLAPIEPLLHFLSCPEMGVSLFWDWDLRASPGIAADSGFVNLDRKRPEAAQLDPLTASQRSDNFVEYGVDNLLDVLKVEVRALLP